MPRKNKPEIIPKDLAEYYHLRIDIKLFPNDETVTSGSFVFSDKSRLIFTKTSLYYPEAQGEADSIAQCLLNDLIDFNTHIGNTNEVGFEFSFKDNSFLRQVPLGKPLPKISDDYVEPIPTKKKLDETLELWKKYAPDEYKELYNPEFFVFDKEKLHYIEVATGRVITRNELKKAFREFSANHSGISKLAKVRKVK